jgi:predicted Zn-dependent protease
MFADSSYDPKIFVLRRSEPNALVLPGGEIFVFSGIFNISRNSSEIASVIGHEVFREILLTQGRPLFPST